MRKKYIHEKEYWLGHTREYVKVACRGQDQMLENQLVTGKISAFLQDDILLMD